MTRTPPLAAVLVSLAVVGCFGNTPAPSARYFWLGTWLDLKPYAGEPLPVVLQVEEFDTEPAFDHLRLVYRVSNDQIRHYRFRQWVSKPGRLVRDAVRRYFQVGGWLRHVTEAPSPIPDFVLRGRVLAIEQVERGEQWVSHLSLVMRLRRSVDQKVVWTGVLDQEVRVRNRTPEEIVAQFTIMLRQFLDRERPRMLAAMQK
jgi:ABC-type uncharacterized transport system auxiliary subunit